MIFGESCGCDASEIGAGGDVFREAAKGQGHSGITPNKPISHGNTQRRTMIREKRETHCY